jgi:uncharacterized protein (DUF952 family)
MSAPVTILHLVPAADWRAIAPGQPYAPPSLAAEGFIHCTASPEVLLHVANSFYAGVPGDFLVLEIALARVRAPVRFEPPASPPPGSPLASELFPHIYGPLNIDAVAAVRPARRAPGGAFLAT